MDREESTNSSEEVLLDEESKELGVGRSYECVFCKRGFNTAQALGGHMNIHRKDRLRNKPNSTKQPQRFYPSSASTPRPYFPTADLSNSTLYERNQQPAADWRMRMSLDFTPVIDHRGMEQDKELDLELRLGYDS
ncbi:zinc finger protein 5-like [Salvia hispanica]|uniref:zinc finger protein 5-like n=1 Tax=Salvia hispanica TaxID=49212 RepID=UPI002009CBBE|nr:zinc finger protein 5-like [Salvia hispanica]